MIFFRRLFFVFPVFMLLAGCSGRYQVRPLKTVKRSKAHFVQNKEGVEVRVRVLEKRAVAKLFNGQHFSEKSGVVTHAVTICNATDKPVLLKAEQIKLGLLSAEETYVQLGCSYAFPAFLWIGGGTAIAVTGGWALLTASVPAGVSHSIGYAFMFGFAGMMFVAIPAGLVLAAVTLGSGSKFNRALNSDIQNKILTSLTIAPHNQETRLFFARASQPAFTLAIQGSDKHQILFNIGLNR